MYSEGVGDLLVRGISLPVDALGVDLQQDRDAVPALQATSVADATATRPEADTLALSQGP